MWMQDADMYVRMLARLLVHILMTVLAQLMVDSITTKQTFIMPRVMPSPADLQHYETKHGNCHVLCNWQYK